MAGKALSNIVGGIIKIQVGGLRVAGSIFDGIINVSHIEQIFNTFTKLPVLKQLKSTIYQLRYWNTAILKQNCKEFGNFISGIILDHKDFFIPLFNRALNIFLTFTNAVHQLYEGGKFAGNEN